mmetsp:Transcript_20094/g.51257  ORF Transcript_20094/g.51257 Transcript_20094/m.51257 type:complete len:151 (-) Transcript_20094:671-1123(-)
MSVCMLFSLSLCFSLLHCSALLVRHRMLAVGALTVRSGSVTITACVFIKAKISSRKFMFLMHGAGGCTLQSPNPWAVRMSWWTTTWFVGRHERCVGWCVVNVCIPAKKLSRKTKQFWEPIQYLSLFFTLTSSRPFFQERVGQPHAYHSSH